MALSKKKMYFLKASIINTVCVQRFNLSNLFSISWLNVGFIMCVRHIEERYYRWQKYMTLV